MAEKTFNTRIKLKKDTHANWTTNNPVLLDGEIAIVDNGGIIEVKIGDGSTAYSSLPFYKAPVGNSTLTASRALVSDSNGKAAVSAVTSTELGYLDGVTSAIQTQLNGKASTATASTTANGLMSSADKSKLNGLSNYTLPVATSSALGGVKSGTDITVDSSGNVSVNDSSHNHAASNITSGTLVVARGGTGVTANPSMLTNLGSTSAASVFAASPRPGVTGTLPIANGGTGATDKNTAKINLGIIISTSEPTSSDGSDGDIWLVVE